MSPVSAAHWQHAVSNSEISRMPPSPFSSWIVPDVHLGKREFAYARTIPTAGLPDAGSNR
jgi:hypothetical protein